MTDPAIQELLDKQALTELVATYCRGVDRHDPELLRSIYHDGAVIEHGVFRGDGDGFVEWVLTESAAAKAQESVHTALSPLFEIRGDVAHGETRYLVVLASPGATEGTISLVRAAGRYVDRFERLDGRWGIVHRRMVRDVPNMVGELEALPGAGHHGRRDRDDPSYDRVW